MLKTLRPNQPEDLTECLEQSLVKYLEGSLPYTDRHGTDEGIEEERENSMISSSSSEEELGFGQSILSCTSVGVGHSRSGSAAQSSCFGSGLSPDVARSSRGSRLSEYAESEIRKETIKSKAKTKHRKQKYTFKAYHPLRFQVSFFFKVGSGVQTRGLHLTILEPFVSSRLTLRRFAPRR